MGEEVYGSFRLLDISSASEIYKRQTKIPFPIDTLTFGWECTLI